MIKKLLNLLFFKYDDTNTKSIELEIYEIDNSEGKRASNFVDGDIYWFEKDEKIEPIENIIRKEMNSYKDGVYVCLVYIDSTKLEIYKIIKYEDCQIFSTDSLI